ncbi:pre-mRNA-splicing factor 38B [Exaiptasia diaphana]|uniref:Pre-mRNA-splicing factor 38 n=1 Tax=Exaiptasia diaphana TaxID=2652724 RepID=A0A913XWU6_EXADI|nr:pre-mRNA-splicing factor 38B [Exaiptasia diaphana]
MDSEENVQYEGRPSKKSNVLPIWGSERTMNLNNMILTNVLQSPYFKNQLYQLKTYHEVVDEIYYKVDHLEPWEKGSRKTSGQVGMCGGVRGVGAGGIVSTAYCILYKLFTLRLTRKQLNGLITHVDSPYIRALGFMYIRYCQPPADMWDWYEAYLEDEEELDPKAGTGCPMTIGQLVRSFMLKLEWYGTLFPRIPVPIQKEIERKLQELNLCDDHKRNASESWPNEEENRRDRNGRSDRESMDRSRRHDSKDRFRTDRDSRTRRSRSRERSSRRDSDRRDHREKQRSRSRDRDRRRHSRTPERRRSRSRSRDRKRDRHRDSEKEHKKRRDDSRERRGDSKNRRRSRSR